MIISRVSISTGGTVRGGAGGGGRGAGAASAAGASPGVLEGASEGTAAATASGASGAASSGSSSGGAAPLPPLAFSCTVHAALTDCAFSPFGPLYRLSARQGSGPSARRKGQVSSGGLTLLAVGALVLHGHPARWKAGFREGARGTLATPHSRLVHGICFVAASARHRAREGRTFKHAAWEAACLAVGGRAHRRRVEAYHRRISSELSLDASKSHLKPIRATPDWPSASRDSTGGGDDRGSTPSPEPRI